VADSQTLVIAHRGASGYLPEHTLEAKAYAHALGADYLEQDLVATRDDQVIVIHDIHLDRVTNVASVYPDRHRDDGRYYARDFDLAEIQSLAAGARRGDDGETAAFPNRYPLGFGPFRIPTLREEIKFIQGLNRATGRITGIYPEIKNPAWHRAEGVDLSALVIDQLDDLGYRTKSDPVFLQCFDAAEVRRIRHDLGCSLKLVQLIGENSWGQADTDYAVLKTPEGLREVARTVDGVGAWIPHLVDTAGVDGQPVSTGFVKSAHEAGLVVHPYTFQVEEIGAGFESLPEMIAWFADTLGVDGVFTDFPDLALQGLGRT